MQSGILLEGESFSNTDFSSDSRWSHKCHWPTESYLFQSDAWAVQLYCLRTVLVKISQKFCWCDCTIIHFCWHFVWSTILMLPWACETKPFENRWSKPYHPTIPICLPYPCCLQNVFSPHMRHGLCASLCCRPSDDVFCNLGQWVAGKYVRSVIHHWAKEQPWSSSPWGSVIIWVVSRWAFNYSEVRSILASSVTNLTNVLCLLLWLF